LSELKTMLIMLADGGDQTARDFLRILDSEEITDKHLAALVWRYSKRQAKLQADYTQHLKFCAAELRRNKNEKVDPTEA